MDITLLMAELALQLGVIIFAVRICGKLAAKIGIPSVLGELLSGVLIGPHALGGIPLPGFPQGFCPLGGGEAAGNAEFVSEVAQSITVSPELYTISVIASIVLLFASGLETDIKLFLRYSVAGVFIGLGGAAASFFFGAWTAISLLGGSFASPEVLFLGILSTATSVGITARILSDKKKMDSPEGVTILASAVFDDVLGIIILAITLGVIGIMGGGAGNTVDSIGLSKEIAFIAFKAFAIWLGFTALGLIFSKQLAKFLKLFKNPYDFSILALGIALLLAGFFEKQGLALIIGAYIAGLSLSSTDIAPIIQEKLKGLYDFFVPIFFCVMGMMVDLSEIAKPSVLLFGFIYSVTAILAKLIGCGGPALLLGFNRRGALRIGMGMVPRGEVALIIAGLGLASGILDAKLFGVVILMTFITTLAAPPLLNMSLEIKGKGTIKEPLKGDSVEAVWDFHSPEITNLVVNKLFQAFREEGFFVQTMSMEDSVFHVRKDNIALIIDRDDTSLSITAAEADMPYIKTEVYETIVGLEESLQKLKETFNPKVLKQELAEIKPSNKSQNDDDLLSIIKASSIKLDLVGQTKEAIIKELLQILDDQGLLDDSALVLQDVLDREKIASTGMQHGIALPHGKTEGVSRMVAALGISRNGIDFESLDGEKTNIFVLLVSPKRTAEPHVRFLAAISKLLGDEMTRKQLLNADSPEEAAVLLRRG
ncbi:MAG: cation:proton antiporter [Spirochaetaceae bacterium]|jgi:fructose-specific phosphotransferase system IIA component|nr:cation:proton antiporter [Spirochaetaceae bacterium]